MANKITIDIEVNGKMQKATVSAKKLNQALNETGKSARTADRNVKGVAQASSGASKNFSKMSQGMGGLVGIYASFAAQVFALTAAFGFLKRAADLENLRKAQIDFASSSGLAIKTLTVNLQESSQGMMDFQMAAQAAATGAAKGFANSQLEELVVGATKASKGLGLEFEDTFNRLLRGVSKAEPELLDELGITLRLEEATERYATAIGKSRDALTTAERSQAVFVETMRQLNDTFGAIDPEANPFVQLQKTFQKIIEDITEKAMPAVTGLVNIINNNAQAAATAFAALATLILANIAGFGGAITFMVGGVAGAVAKMGKLAVGGTKSLTTVVATKVGSFIKNKAEDLELAALFLEEKLQNVTTKLEKSASAAISGGAKSKTLQKLAKGEIVSPQALGRLKKDLERVQKEIEETGETASQAFGGLTVEAIQDINKEINKFEDNLDSSEKEIKGFRKVALVSLKAVEKTAGFTAGSLRFMGDAAAFAKRNVGKLKAAMKFGGFVIVGLIAITKALAELKESPIRAIDGFKTMITGVVKTLQTGLNLITDGLNRLLSNSIVETALSKMGYDTSEGIFGTFTFADNIEATLDNLENRALTALGTNREELEVIQSKNDFIKGIGKYEEKRLQTVKELTNEYGTLAADFANIFSGKAGQGDVQAQMKAIATGDLGGARKALEKYEEEKLNIQNRQSAVLGLFEAGTLSEAEKDDLDKKLKLSYDTILLMQETAQSRYNNILESKGFSLLPPKFIEALKNGTDEEIAALQAGALGFGSGMSNLKGMGSNLKNQLGSGDPLQLRIGLEQMVNEVENLDSIMKNLGFTAKEIEAGPQRVLIKKLLGDNYEQLPQILRQLETELDGIAFDRFINQRDAVGNVRLPSLTKNQVVLQQKAKEANLLLREKQAMLVQLEQKIITGGSLAEEAHQKEITQRQREIELLREKAGVAEDNMDFMTQAGDKLSNSFESGFASAFDSIIQGTSSVKDAFLNMGKMILQVLSRLIAEMIAVKIMQTIIGMGTTNAKINYNSSGAAVANSPSGFGAGADGNFFRYGGIAGKGYSTGGVAKGSQAGYPAILHGTEAVVPLPNGKSIPVDMKGAGQQNNVTVNVSVDSNGNAAQDTQADSNSSQRLGTMIASAVQKELHNQKRAGGILNPIGVS